MYDLFQGYLVKIFLILSGSIWAAEKPNPIISIPFTFTTNYFEAIGIITKMYRVIQKDKDSQIWLYL